MAPTAATMVPAVVVTMPPHPMPAKVMSAEEEPARELDGSFRLDRLSGGRGDERRSAGGAGLEREAEEQRDDANQDEPRQHSRTPGAIVSG
jgi:hypothetical protein